MIAKVQEKRQPPHLTTYGLSTCASETSTSATPKESLQNLHIRMAYSPSSPSHQKMYSGAVVPMVIVSMMCSVHFLLLHIPACTSFVFEFGAPCLKYQHYVTVFFVIYLCTFCQFVYIFVGLWAVKFAWSTMEGNPSRKGRTRH